ncbi:MAG: hypothetical protein ACUVXA_15490 [Candidatus Jordarchaeum sp.]|uniref:hypothetical protein n=1 Tax=Candidatus Jordarchaeum sp. TaxID=2823881 RepID=UPI0040499481
MVATAIQKFLLNQFCKSLFGVKILADAGSNYQSGELFLNVFHPIVGGSPNFTLEGCPFINIISRLEGGF